MLFLIKTCTKCLSVTVSISVVMLINNANYSETTYLLRHSG